MLGPGGADAVRVLGSAAAALGDRGWAVPGEVDVLLAPLVAEADDTARTLGAQLDAAGHRSTPVLARDGFRAAVEDLAEQVHAAAGRGSRRDPVYLVLLGADAADALLERAGTEALRNVLHFGPEAGVHVLGWWRSAAAAARPAVAERRRWTTSARGSRWTCRASELNPFAPGLGLTWSPRPGRGLFFDRAQHSRPQVVFVPQWPSDPVEEPADEEPADEDGADEDGADEDPTGGTT